MSCVNYSASRRTWQSHVRHVLLPPTFGPLKKFILTLPPTVNDRRGINITYRHTPTAHDKQNLKDSENRLIKCRKSVHYSTYASVSGLCSSRERQENFLWQVRLYMKNKPLYKDWGIAVQNLCEENKTVGCS